MHNLYSPKIVHEQVNLYPPNSVHERAFYMGTCAEGEDSAQLPLWIA